MTVGFNFLEAPELPAPQVSDAQAEDILATHYGLRARATSLGSQQDKNFVVTVDGEIVGVLKIANPAFNATEIEAQDLAAEKIAEAEPLLRMAVPLPNLAGQKCTALTGLVDGTAYVRLLRFLPGGTLLDSGYLSPTAVAGLGEVAGRVSRALEGFRHPGLDRVLQWDLRYGTAVVAELISYVTDPLHRARVDAAATEAWSRIAPLVDELPRQAVHLDLTDANVVVARRVDSSAHPDGVIDFGDLSDSWAVSELAITASSVLGHAGNEPISILPAVRAFHAIRPLTTAEVDALWPLLVLRTAVLIVSGAQQASLDPDNPYLAEQSGGEWRMFEQATSVPIDVMTEVIRADLGLAARPDPVAGSLDRRRSHLGGDARLGHHVRRLRLCIRKRRFTQGGCRRRISQGGSARRCPARRHPIRSAAAEPDPQAQPGKPRRRGDRHQHLAGSARHGWSPRGTAR